jgi:WD40 repeat protein
MPDGRHVVSGSMDYTLKVWDLETGREVHTLAGHESWVQAVAVTPDGQYAVSGSRDYTLKVWDLQTGREMRTLAGHRDHVLAVAVMPDGRYAISGSDDRTLKVWNLKAGQELATVALDGASYCIAVAPNGFTILAGDWATNVYCLQYVEGNKKTT